MPEVVSKKYFVGVSDFSFEDIIYHLGTLLGYEKKGLKIKVMDFFSEELKLDIIFKSHNQQGYINGTEARYKKYFNQYGTSNKLREQFSEIEAAHINGTVGFIEQLLISLQENINYKEQFFFLKNGFEQINNCTNQIANQQKDELCQGFNEHVLLDLIKAFELFTNSFVSSADWKLIYAKSIIMTCSYYVANGCDFINLALETKVQAVASADSINLKKHIPKLEEGFKNELICKVNANGVITHLRNLICEKNIFIEGEGGSGKTTLLVSLANEIVNKGNKIVFIHSKNINQSYPDDFVFSELAKFLPEMVEIAEYYSNNERILAKERFDGLIIFIDALDEAMVENLPPLLKQINQIIEHTNARVVVSSRYEYPELKDIETVSIMPLEPLSILNGHKLEMYKQLPAKKKQILTKPMYLALFLDSDLSTEISMSSLLRYKIKRDIIEKGKANPGEKELLKAILPEFIHWLYSHYRQFLSFTLYDVQKFLNCASKQHIDEKTFIKSLEKVYRIDASETVFSIHHQSEIDFLIAEYIQSNLHTVDDVVNYFSNGNVYSKFVLTLLSELMDKNIIDKLRKKNMKGDNWYSKETALATAAILNIFGENEIDLSGLNLTEYTIGSLVSDVSFRNSLVNDSTFSNSLDSAVFGLIYEVETNRTYAIGRNSLYVFDDRLRQIDSCNFANETRVGNQPVQYCNIDNGDAIAFVTAHGQGYVYNKKENTICKLYDNNVISVAADGNQLLFGLEGGRIDLVEEQEICDTIQLSEDSNKKIVPVQQIGDYIVYVSEDSIKAYDMDLESSIEIWNVKQLVLPINAERTILDDLKIRKVIKGKNNEFILLFYKNGISNIIKINITQQSIKNKSVRGQLITNIGAKPVDFTENSVISYNKSLNIDRNKVTDIHIDKAENLLYCSFNAGNIHVYSLEKNSHKLIGIIDFTDSVYGQSIESFCIANRSEVIIAPSSRALYKIHHMYTGSDITWAQLAKAKGINVGIRRMLLRDDKLYTTNFNHSICILKRDNDGMFKFEQKLRVGKEWAWCIAEGENGRIFVGADNSIYELVNNTEFELIKEFRFKVENIICIENLLIAAVGHTVYKIYLSSSEKVITEINMGSLLSEHRPLSFGLDQNNNLYIGYASNTKNTESADVFLCEPPYTHAVAKTLSRENPELLGWNRSVQAIGDFLLCGGLEMKNSASKDCFSVLWHHYFISSIKLSGHSDYVACARILQCDETKEMCIVSIGYDGFLNVYKFNPYEFIVPGEYLTAVQPIVREKISDFNLYDIAVEDETTVYVSDAKGDIFKVKIFSEEKIEVHTIFNNNDIWVTNSRLRKIDSKSTISENIKIGLQSLNNTL